MITLDVGDKIKLEYDEESKLYKALFDTQNRVSLLSCTLFETSDKIDKDKIPVTASKQLVVKLYRDIEVNSKDIANGVETCMMYTGENKTIKHMIAGDDIIGAVKTFIFTDDGKILVNGFVINTITFMQAICDGELVLFANIKW